jgi:hypothetical protein
MVNTLTECYVLVISDSTKLSYLFCFRNLEELSILLSKPGVLSATQFLHIEIMCISKQYKQAAS